MYRHGYERNVRVRWLSVCVATSVRLLAGTVDGLRAVEIHPHRCDRVGHAVHAGHRARHAAHVSVRVHGVHAAVHPSGHADAGTHCHAVAVWVAHAGERLGRVVHVLHAHTADGTHAAHRTHAVHAGHRRHRVACGVVGRLHGVVRRLGKHGEIVAGRRIVARRTLLFVHPVNYRRINLDDCV